MEKKREPNSQQTQYSQVKGVYYSQVKSSKVK